MTAPSHDCCDKCGRAIPEDELPDDWVIVPFRGEGWVYYCPDCKEDET